MSRKQALYAFDGTWNQKKDGDDPDYTNTNVARFHAAYEAAMGPQFYRKGVGTRHGAAGRVLGGVFGLGELPRIMEGHRQLCQDWIDSHGELDIDIVGFSRGAATALDFCNYLLDNGIKDPVTDARLADAPTIRFLGLWDVVAAFGLANLGNEVLNFGHHLTMPHAKLQYCFHAMALDEKRLSFLPTRLPGACEVWFRGVHSDVGGGNGNRGLNDISLRWMASKAKGAGLPIGPEHFSLEPAVVAPDTDYGVLPDVRVIASVDRQHYTVSPMPGFATPPATCPVETADDEVKAEAIGAGGVEVLPKEVQNRIDAVWEAALDRAQRRGFNTLPAETQIWLRTLIEGRIGLVQDAASLVEARRSIERLIDLAADDMKLADFHSFSAAYLERALWRLPHLFPLSD